MDFDLLNIGINTCGQGHKFAKLPDHPKKDGIARCPHCLADELDSARAENPKRGFILQFILNARLSGRAADLESGSDRQKIVDAAGDLYDKSIAASRAK